MRLARKVAETLRYMRRLRTGVVLANLVACLGVQLIQPETVDMEGALVSFLHFMRTMCLRQPMVFPEVRGGGGDAINLGMGTPKISTHCRCMLPELLS